MTKSLSVWLCKTVTRTAVLVLSLIVLSGCVTSVSRDTAQFPEHLTQATWTISPLQNKTKLGTAADTAQSLIETHMRSRGLNRFDTSNPDYAISGEIETWDYNSAIERFPTVSVNLKVVNARTGETIWRGDEKQTGRLTKTLTGVADSVIADLLGRFKKAQPALYDHKSRISKNTTSRVPAIDLTSGILNHHSSSTLSNVSGALQTVTGSIDGFTDVADANLVGKGVAFYYGANPPVSALSQYDRVILESDNVSAEQVEKIAANGASLFAYLSVGEVGSDRNWSDRISSSWVLGTNDAWGSSVMDLAQPGWSGFLMQRVDALVEAGYEGLFLDTMDSFLLYARTDQDRSRQLAGLERIISSVKQRHPELRLIANRGFEVIQSIGHQLEGIAAESLYMGWNNSAQQYQAVSSEDRQWLLGKLKTAKQDFDLDVIVIDYLPPSRRDEARQIAAEIVGHDFLPWVSTPALDYLGVGAQEVVPREVLLIYNSANDGAIEDSSVHRMIATPLEYFGYVPVYVDLAKDDLPVGELKGVVAGVVSWLHRPETRADYPAWLLQQMRSTVPVAIFGTPGVPLNQEMADRMGVSFGATFDFSSAEPYKEDELVGFERELSPRLDAIGVTIRNMSSINSVHLGFQDEAGEQIDTVMTGPWGGLALEPTVTNLDPDGTGYWVINPFRFIQLALSLPTLPMPDVTTLNGRRLWLAHIDGDALPSWAEMPGKKLGAEVIYEDILKQYKMPHTVSVVEAEMTAFPYFDGRLNRMFDVAEKILNEPYVEAASHTYSHPFKWKLIDGEKNAGKYNLGVPNYQFSYERETTGSLAFINDRLLHSGKQARTMLWSGDALPGEPALAILERENIVNMNGGNTTIAKSKASVSAVSPMARPVGDYIQVYAPIMNENVYTNDWTGPFDGFRHVIETLEMTDLPRRLKPLNIYYHFYSGTKIASMQALNEVYEWSVQQDIHPVFASEYAELVPAFRKVGVSRYLDSTWKVSSLGPIQSLRILGDQYWPDLQDSVGLSGARQLHDGVYLHSMGADKVLFSLTDKKPKGRYLVAANGRVHYWNNEKQGVRFRVSGHVPLELELKGTEGCSISSQGSIIRGVPSGTGSLIYKFSTRDSFDAVLNCQA